jgi:hypothetical protein
MTIDAAAELRTFLTSFHGKRTFVSLLSGHGMTGIVNATLWDNGRPAGIYLARPENTNLGVVLIPWHAVAALGKVLDHDTRPSARGDEPARF